MTQIAGFIEPTRRKGELGVHSVDSFNIVVPNLTEASTFYEAFGLKLKNEKNGFGLYTQSHSHRWGGVTEGPRKRLSHISFGTFDDDFEPLRSRLQQNGVTQLEGPKGFESNGAWFRDPNGTLIEICVAPKSSPNEKSQFSAVSAGPGVQAAPYRSKAPKVYPRRLSHVLMFSPDVTSTIDFYRRNLGVRLSDHSGDGIAFMHGIHGSDHHMIAFAKSNGPGLHHLSWDVGSVNEIGLGTLQMLNNGYDKGWGLGRHVLGSNYFHYVRDPWGSYCEYSADIDFISAEHDWASGDRPDEDAFYLWGPTPPTDFVVNYEATT